MAIHIYLQNIENSNKYFMLFSLRASPVIEYNNYIVKGLSLNSYPTVFAD